MPVEGENTSGGAVRVLSGLDPGHKARADVSEVRPGCSPRGPRAHYEPRVDVSDASGLDASHEAPGFAMLHVCRRSLRNVLGQDGTTRDAAG